MTIHKVTKLVSSHAKQILSTCIIHAKPQWACKGWCCDVKNIHFSNPHENCENRIFPTLQAISFSATQDKVSICEDGQNTEKETQFPCIWSRPWLNTKEMTGRLAGFFSMECCFSSVAPQPKILTTLTEPHVCKRPLLSGLKCWLYAALQTQITFMRLFLS